MTGDCKSALIPGIIEANLKQVSSSSDISAQTFWIMDEIQSSVNFITRQQSNKSLIRKIKCYFFVPSPPRQIYSPISSANELMEENVKEERAL